MFFITVCLNTEPADKMFRMVAHDKYFVDKSGVIEIVNERVNTMNRYLCVTKPRRFGKTSGLNMLGAYPEAGNKVFTVNIVPSAVL